MDLMSHEIRVYIRLRGFFGFISGELILTYIEGELILGRKLESAQGIPYDGKSISLGQVSGFFTEKPPKRRNLTSKRKKLSQIKYSKTSKTTCRSPGPQPNH